MRTIKIIFPLILLFAFTLSVNAQITNKRIKFKHGNVTATVVQGINEGVVDTYLVHGKAKQHMTVAIMSIEDNIAFSVLNKRKGKYLPGAESDSNAKNWDGELPSTGDYKIFVTPVQGYGQYKLRVTIE